MTSFIIAGSTGLVGSHILSTLLALPASGTIYTPVRRTLPSTTASPRVAPIIDIDSSNWPAKIAALDPAPEIFFSALGTTKAAAGSLENQRKIDHDLTLSLATAAKKAGTKIFVLISAARSSSKSYLAYPRMKGEIEDDVVALGFDQAIFIRPGIIIGDRSETSKNGGSVSYHLLVESYDFC
jgi:uncharacterized protein YbjT (DUF2867 family)